MDVDKDKLNDKLNGHDAVNLDEIRVYSKFDDRINNELKLSKADLHALDSEELTEKDDILSSDDDVIIKPPTLPNLNIRQYIPPTVQKIAPINVNEQILTRKVFVPDAYGKLTVQLVTFKVNKSNMENSLLTKILCDEKYAGNANAEPKLVLTNKGGKQQLMVYQDPLKITETNRIAQASQLSVNRFIGNAQDGDATQHFEFDEDDFTLSDTFANYMPSKVNIGGLHPDAVVESCSLSNIEPPDPIYSLSLPSQIIQKKKLSALQLESIIYASQKHATFLKDGCRAGFLIGDGAGVGKGRTIAGLILENYAAGRKKTLWISVSNDLKVDAERDLKDIDSEWIPVSALNKMSYNYKISSLHNGAMKSGVLFTTYSSFIAESTTHTYFKTRYDQIVHWLGKKFDGLIIFDECHRAKNYKHKNSAFNTKTATMVINIQENLKNARIVYSSATGATEPRQMAYMTRLGIWGEGTPFNCFDSFINSVEKRGVGAMELVAMDMKMRGMYVARQLSFKGVSFRVEEIDLTDKFIQNYNKYVILWAYTLKLVERGIEKMTEVNGSFDCKHIWSQFWSAHQRFFKYVCISSKVQKCVDIVKRYIHEGKSVIIGLQSTGESQTLEEYDRLNGNLQRHVSIVKCVICQFVKKWFPSSSDSVESDDDVNFCKSFCKNILDSKRKRKTIFNSKTLSKKQKFDSDSESSDSLNESNSEVAYDSDSEASDGSESSSESDSKSDTESVKMEQKNAKESKLELHSSMAMVDKLKAGLNYNHTNHNVVCNNMKKCILTCINDMDDSFPLNTLDLLMEKLGGPKKVAEMTGRKSRTVKTKSGETLLLNRADDEASIETCNLMERKRFMDGKKKITIISEAASSGISLHSDRRVKNNSKRIHITMELAWSADRAIQQFGRSHRSNQTEPPEYVFLISKLAGERRFAASVSKKLESLGALTHGDRRVADMRDLGQFNVDSKYGQRALYQVMRVISSAVPKYGGMYEPSDYLCTVESDFFTRDVEKPDYKGDFFKDAQNGLVDVGLLNSVNTQNSNIAEPTKQAIIQLNKDSNNINKFLNRILGLNVLLQNAIYQYFDLALVYFTEKAKTTGKLDMGIMGRFISNVVFLTKLKSLFDYIKNKVIL
ncbi:Protein strawberry notch [Intoshia linei]|uniref:Protein strawberry notch n=1 Tax=Intoshia linei TaxID=1819745 RepID=A0A177ARA5_9BILA|nr:Protein strawberry notch [Intoshia linei]